MQDIATTNHINSITNCDTPTDAYVYPGKLNVDENGKPLITSTSTPEDYKKSILHSAHKYGLKHFSEFGVSYPNTKVGKEDINPSDVDPNKLKDRTSFFQKIIPEVENENFDPLLAHPDIPNWEQGPDIRSFLPDLNPKTLQGDPRWTAGCALQAMMQKFVPRIKAYEEMLNCGGVTVDDECNICTEDGIPITKASALLLNVIKEIPDSSSKCGKTVPIITPDEVTNFMMDHMNQSLRDHSDAFVEYLKRNYLEISEHPWDIELYAMEGISFFFVKLFRKNLNPPTQKQKLEATGIDFKNAELKMGPENFQKYMESINNPTNLDEDLMLENVYLRYYPDQKEYIASSLNKEIKITARLLVSPLNLSAVSSFSKPIPDYTSMI